MPLIDCLGKAKEVISEKDRKRMMSRSEALKKEGFDSDAAERKAVQEYVSEKHKDLHDQLNKLKTKAGLKAADYKPLAFKEPQKQSAHGYTTQKGLVVSHENGERVVKDSEGSVVTGKRAKDALDEHAQNYNYNQGATAAEKVQQAPEFSSDTQAKRFAIENSENPSEIADIYTKEEKQPVPLSAKEQAIYDHGIGKVTEKSYRQFGDKNNKNNSKARTYFSSKGESIDVVAKSVSDHTGLDVTPQDIVDFIDRFPSGGKVGERLQENEVHQVAKDRFKELTGIPLTDDVATTAAIQLYAPEAQKAATDYVDSHWADTEAMPESELEKWNREAFNEIQNENSNLDYGQSHDSTGEQDNAQPRNEGQNAPVTDQPASGNAQDDASAGNPTATPEATEPGLAVTRKGKLTDAEDGSKVGISHDYRSERADETGQPEPVRGEGWSPGESIEKGDELIANGADPHQIGKDFKETGKISPDDMAVVRSHYNKLAKATNDAISKFGVNSPEDKAAQKAEHEFYDNVVKPMQTAWHKIGMAQQGTVDVDTGTFTGVRRLYRIINGKDMPADKVGDAKELAKDIAKLKAELDELAKQKTEAIEQSQREATKKKTYTERAKEMADRVRKLKSKPFTFKAEDGTEVEVQKMGVNMDGIIEAAAKAIETTGKIADGVAAAIDHVKDSDWYKSLTEKDRVRFKEQLEGHLSGTDDEKQTEGEKKIKYLEKQLSDLAEGKTRNKKGEPQYTPEEQVKIKGLQNQLSDARLENTKVHISNKLHGKSWKQFDPEDRRILWAYAKDKYLHKDIDFDRMIANVAHDFGLRAEDVYHSIVLPKTKARDISQEMYKKMYAVKNARAKAEAWVRAQGDNFGMKALKNVTGFFFTLKTIGHGTVGFITHAGKLLFDPKAWGNYFANFKKQYSMFLSTATHARLMLGLANDPNFHEWIKAGLEIDPKKDNSDYAQMIKAGWIKKAVDGGTRGFDALKLLRFSEAQRRFNDASETERADPELKKKIASYVNHMTGATDARVPSIANVFFFAPKLEVARWQSIADLRHITKLFNKDAAPSDKYQARMVMFGAGRIAATFMTALAANQAFLSLSGSKQSINMSDPTKNDWMKFKAFDHTIDPSGGMTSLVSFLANLAIYSRDGDQKRQTIKDEAGQKIIDYGTGKLSPAASFAWDLYTHHDGGGNVLPMYNDAPRQGKEHLSWVDYTTSNLPIPVAEGFKDFHDHMIDEGMPQKTAKSVMDAVVSAIVVGGVGAHVGNEPKDKASSLRSELENKIKSGAEITGEDFDKARIAPNERAKFVREAHMDEPTKKFYELTPYQQLVELKDMTPEKRNDMKSKGVVHFKGIVNLRVTDPDSYKKYQSVIDNVLNGE